MRSEVVLKPVYYRNGVPEDLTYEGQYITNPYTLSLLATVAHRLREENDSGYREEEKISSQRENLPSQ